MKVTVAIYLRTTGTEPELLSDLRRIIENRGDVLLGTFADDGRLEGKGKNAAWNRLLASLDRIDRILLADPGDLPGRSVGDILTMLATMTAHGVTVAVPALAIDTRFGSAPTIDLIQAYRRAKRSAAIRAGQQKARQQGRHIGRPGIPVGLRHRIMIDLTQGAGIRAAARKHGVSAASVVTIRHEMEAVAERQAA